MPAVLALLFFAVALCAAPGSADQTLETMEKCRDQVVAGLSFSDKMKMKAALRAIQDCPEYVAANKAVIDASTPEAQVKARKSFAQVKLDLLVRQDPSLKLVVEKIRSAQAAALK